MEADITTILSSGNVCHQMAVAKPKGKLAKAIKGQFSVLSTNSKRNFLPQQEAVLVPVGHGCVSALAEESCL